MKEEFKEFWKKYIGDWIPLSALKSISYLSIAEFFIYLSGFLYGVFGARILGPNKLGDLILIISLVKLLSSPFDFELQKPLVKFFQDETNENFEGGFLPAFGIACLLQTMGMVIFGVLFLGFIFLVSPGWSLFKSWGTALGFYALSEIIFRTRILTISAFQAEEQFGRVSVYKGVQALFRDIAPIPFMFWGVQAVCMGYLVVEGLFLVLSLVVIVVQKTPGYGNASSLNVDYFKTITTQLFYRSRSNYVAVLLTKSLKQIQHLVLGQFVSPRAVSFFSIGRKFNYMVSFTAQPLFTYLFPRLTDKWKQDKDEFFYTLRKYFLTGIPFFFGTSLIFCLLSIWFIPFVYGQQFFPAIWVVLIIVPVKALLVPFNIFNRLTIAVNQARAMVNARAIKFVSGVTLALLLTYYYNYIGAAVAHSGSLLAILSYRLYFLFNQFGDRWIRPRTDQRNG